jgi:hypothetical protein
VHLIAKSKYNKNAGAMLERSQINEQCKLDNCDRRIAGRRSYPQPEVDGPSTNPNPILLVEPGVNCSSMPSLTISPDDCLISGVS